MKIVRNIPKFQPLGLAVVISIATIVVCYAIRPEFIGIRRAFSSLGAYPPTSYIFTTGFVLSAGLIFVDATRTKNILQKICRLLAALGFAMLGVFQIEHGQTRGDLHRIGGLIMLLAIIASMLGHVISGWRDFTLAKRLVFLSFSLLGILSVVMSILSSSQFQVISLQGLAQYIGLVSLIGWALLDSYQVSTSKI